MRYARHAFEHRKALILLRGCKFLHEDNRSRPLNRPRRVRRLHRPAGGPADAQEMANTGRTPPEGCGIGLNDHTGQRRPPR